MKHLTLRDTMAVYGYSSITINNQGYLEAKRDYINARIVNGDIQTIRGILDLQNFKNFKRVQGGNL